MVGDKFGHGIDDTHIKVRGAPVLEEPALDAYQKMIADKLTTAELMTTAVVALPPVVRVRELVDTLRGTQHQVRSKLVHCHVGKLNCVVVCCVWIHKIYQCVAQLQTRSFVSPGSGVSRHTGSQKGAGDSGAV